MKDMIIKDNSMDLISVIVPVYNSRRFIGACCRSILNQSYGNLEVILVDDGSEDQSLSICQRIAKQDKRIVIIATSNNGVSVARNIGLKKATGKYLCFVDSDDLLPPKAIESLYIKITKDQADFCQGSITAICTAHNRLFDTEKEDRCAEREDYDAWRNVVGGLYWGPVAALYKTEIIRQHNLLFPVEVKLAEDSIFLALYLQHCGRVSTCKDHVYLYNRINAASATRQGYEEIWKWLYAFSVAYNDLYPDGYQHKPSAVEEIALRNLDYAYGHYINQCQHLGKRTLLNYLELVHTEFSTFLNNLSSDDLIRPDSERLIQRYRNNLKAYAYEEIYNRIKEENKDNYIKLILKKPVKRILSRIRIIKYYGI